VLVNVTGLPEKITVTRSSGTTSLDRAAEKAVQHWRFTPGSRDGKPVAMRVDIPIRFRLTDANP
jgi:protein TonB